MLITRGKWPLAHEHMDKDNYLSWVRIIVCLPAWSRLDPACRLGRVYIWLYQRYIYIYFFLTSTWYLIYKFTNLIIIVEIREKTENEKYFVYSEVCINYTMTRPFIRVRRELYRIIIINRIIINYNLITNHNLFNTRISS